MLKLIEESVVPLVIGKICHFCGSRFRHLSQPLIPPLDLTLLKGSLNLLATKPIKATYARLGGEPAAIFWSHVIY